MLFVLLADHTAETCPTSNSTTREILLKGGQEIPNMAKRLGVNIVTGPLGNREHLVVLVVESQSADAVDQFIVESGLQQWNRVRVIPSKTMQEGLQEISKLKPIF